MEIEKKIKLAPLIVLTCATIFLLITIMTTNTDLMKFYIVGLVFLAIAITTQLFNEKYGYWMTGLLLIFGTFSFAAFTPTIYFFSIGIIKFDLLCLPTAILYLIVHRKELPDWIEEIRAS